MNNRHEPRACAQEFQEFVDCMYIFSSCVKTGGMSFKECVESELIEDAMHEKCREVHKIFMKCWLKIVRIITKVRLTQKLDLEDFPDFFKIKLFRTDPCHKNFLNQCIDGKFSAGLDYVALTICFYR